MPLVLPPPQQPTSGAEVGTGSFLEPISGQTIPRNGDQPINRWIADLPRTDVGLSTLDHWQAGISPEATAQQIRADLSQEIAPLPAGLQLRTSLLDGYHAQVDNVKVGYAMGQVAAGIEARIAANPSVPHDGAAALAQELRNQGAVLSYGAAREATTAPNDYAFNGRCYTDANAMARAAIAEFNNPTGPVIREYTPAMQQRDAQAAMDRAVLGQDNPLGMTWGQTAWLYARGNGASLERQQQAYALGTGGDALLGIAGSFAGVSAARDGIALPGGQARPIGGTREPELRGNPTVVRPGPAVRASVAEAPAAKGIGTAQDFGIPKSLSPRQDLHTPPVTDGRSVLTAKPSELLDGLHRGDFTILRQPKPGQVVVDFGRPIGEYWSNGVRVGETQFGSVSYGKKGAHIIPANPNQR